MEDTTDKALEGLALYDGEFKKDANFRNIYQEVADYIFPRENQITTTRAKGEVIGRDIVDTTGITASIDMAAGLSINLFPPGDRFYNILMEDDDLNKLGEVKRKLGQMTEISHRKRADSNFMLQANETLRSLGTFGTGCMYSEYLPGIGLNYTDYDIGCYTFLENDRGIVDTMLVEFKYTAKQAFQRWGKNSGETVLNKMEDTKTSGEEFKFVWITRPRSLEKQKGKDKLSMPFETIFISRTDKVVVEEGGYPEFPFQVSRWTKSSGEKWGRGVGTYAIGLVKTLQDERYGLTDCAELHLNPPKEVLDTFEGEVRIRPGDLNFVQEMNSIRAIQQNALGNFVITKDIIEMDQDTVRKMFYNDAFNQLEQLKGDRRNELEIRSRLAEGLRKLVMPVGRIQTEWLTGLVKRDISLLGRAGEFGNDFPPEMQDFKQDGTSTVKPFKIEYIGRLSLELQAAQSMGWLRWIQEGMEIEQIVPGIIDNVDVDGGYRNRGITLGVSVDDMASEEEVAKKRKVRAEKEQQALQLQMAQMSGQINQGLAKAPEEGSPAEALMNS